MPDDDVQNPINRAPIKIADAGVSSDLPYVSIY